MERLADGDEVDRTWSERQVFGPPNEPSDIPNPPACRLLFADLDHFGLEVVCPHLYERSREIQSHTPWAASQVQQRDRSRRSDACEKIIKQRLGIWRAVPK